MLKAIVIEFCVFLCATEITSGILTRVLKISQGKLRGLRSISGQNQYFGIPYAVSRRFQPPEEPLKWEGTFNAIDRFTSCAQTLSFLSLGKEDCLLADVYVPEKAKRGDKLPVFVFFHGGGYYYGSRSHYDPEFLVSKNIIAVIINYRMGVLGFLCLDGVSNLGLKDQVAALKWIQKNIASFGGDPDNVTISGQSAGASAAGMHIFSKLSKGLFHKAILFSGIPFAPWAFNAEPLQSALEDARKLDQVESAEDVHRVFATTTIQELLRVTQDSSLNSYFKYAPCMDNDTSNPFFHDAPYNAIKSGTINSVPIISGMNNVEGMLFYGLHTDESLKEWNDNFVKRLPVLFTSCAEDDREDIANKIRYHYFKNRTIEKTAVESIVDYYSDWLSYSSVYAFSEIMSNMSNKPIYNYMFSYEGDRNFAKLLFGARSRLRGATHTDDIFYVFKPAGIPLLLSSEDKLVIDRLTVMLANFMKFGNPTPSKSKLVPLLWPKFSTNTSLMLNVDRDLSVVEIPKSHRGEFFLDIICTYGNIGHVPCESKNQCKS